MAYVYLIRNGDTWIFKIGIANDVETRLAQLQTGNPVELKIESSYEFHNADSVEKVLHQKWAGVRKHGEWFGLDVQAIGQFEEICQLLGGIQYVPNAEKSTPNAVEEAEKNQEKPNVGAKWDYAAMFADGWRMDFQDSRRLYWNWRRGSDENRETIYGGVVADLPRPIEHMRRIYRDGEKV